ncbi:SMP-30/Gluconolaconase/LRE-like region [Devosia equisanguinis]|uniref:SMP-30/Gluconolaconase/LRE-like region n=1 Tax=Devosia equisanguinis TaxID=2490941 RepID=A0A3S4CFG3_9HYPH|nr:SMP-30/gluconolactonase/LRE family protein [Devosia equisanguinis]VDS06819.1 SMP-30/Gluconolaconase/LRE-like region [Devosia equisanguinis]
MRNLLSATSVACLLLAPMSLSAMAAEAWRTDGLSTPESVVYDEANQRLIVSNIIGEATEADGKGSLSTIALDGTMIDANWVEGLDAPKGSAIAGGKLYVADISNIRVVDLASGAVETIAVDGATFLNDVTAGDDGAVYVTDTFANRIYRVADGAAALFLEDAALGSPNGILFDQGALVVAGFGQLAEKQEDMVPGGLVSVDIASKAITPMAEKVGFLDGIVRVGDALVVSDFFGGKIISIAADGTQTTLAELGMGTADIGTDGTAIYVPLMMQNQVVKLDIE